jgi:ABC-type transporter Mla subunit MlaD
MSRAARLGAFIVATLAILAAGVFIIGDKQYLFSSTYQLKAQFDNVVGLDAGADVRVGGVHSGTVSNIVLPHKPGEKVTVVMDLSKSTHEIIKQDSVATIETEGLLGNQYLAISFGSAGKADVRSGDTIASEPPLEMADLFKKTSDILDTSQQAIQNTTRATANLDSISAKINSGQGTAGALVNDKQLYNNLEQTSSSMRDTMVQAQTGVTDFQDNKQAQRSHERRSPSAACEVRSQTQCRTRRRYAPWRMALAKFWAPVPWMLEAAIILQAVLHEYVEAAVIAGSWYSTLRSGSSRRDAHRLRLPR